MTQKLFSVVTDDGKNLTLFLADDALRLSSQSFSTIEDFEAAWKKKMSMATKLQVRYDSIRSATKETNSLRVRIVYRTRIRTPFECVFTFNDAEDCEVFLTFLEKELYLTKTHEQLTPLKASGPALLELVLALGLTIFCYFEAIAIRNGTATEPTGAKDRLFLQFLGFIGDKGVLAIGVILCGYLVFKIKKRYTNPPDRIKFMRQ